LKRNFQIPAISGPVGSLFNFIVSKELFDSLDRRMVGQLDELKQNITIFPGKMLFARQALPANPG
jgi:hypothetical protein